jgi:hypothetical protein
MSVLFGAAGLAASAAGVVVGFLILIPLYALGGMGAGDVKLLAAAGSFLGPWGALLAGIFTLLAGGALGLGALIWQRIVIPLVAVYEFLPRIWGASGPTGRFLTRWRSPPARLPAFCMRQVPSVPRRGFARCDDCGSGHMVVHPSHASSLDTLIDATLARLAPRPQSVEETGSEPDVSL